MKALVFGEILWDVFGAEQKIGGAAFNFAAHMASLGDEVHFCSAVGQDELGERAHACLMGRGMPLDALQTVAQPTGACHVTLDAAGQPSYHLLDDVAYDYAAPVSYADMDMLYIDTLGRRGALSRKTSQAMMDSGAFREIFFDVNVRKPFISPETLDEGLRAATVVKVSREEAGVMHELGVLPERYDAPQLCRELSKRYGQIQQIIVTLDKDGALLYDVGTDRLIESMKPQSRLVSAVGAGDSFSACFMHNYMNGIAAEEALNRAVLLSDYVVTQLEAVPDCPDELLARIR